MRCYQKVTENLYWVGGNDRRIAQFENVYPVPEGISYNAYLYLEEKTVLLDTVDRAVSPVFFENLEALLAGRKLDYLIVNHMEPDHAATMSEVVLRYPEVKIVCNLKVQKMIGQFFTFDTAGRFLTVGEGDTLKCGGRTFHFIMAPMVHWPEVMMTYEDKSRVLFSADAFGTFGALNGNLFDDGPDFQVRQLDENRRYYSNIVGKYGAQVQAVLKKAAGLDIGMICSLHGPIFRKNISWMMEKYHRWSTYTPEDPAVLIAYASVYGNTQNAAEILAGTLAERGVRDIRMYDVSVTDPSVIVAEAFRCSHLVFASTTYNAGIFVNMENLLHDLMAHNLQNRTVALLENGSWAPTAGGLMRCLLEKGKNMRILDHCMTIQSSLKEDQLDTLCALADQLAGELVLAPDVPAEEKEIEPNAFFKISYGLFVLSARDAARDNGCIINTVMQVTDQPKRLTIAVNKANFTHDMILKTGVFNLSVLSIDAPFSLFQRFGFHSGKDTDKLADFHAIARSENGLFYLTETANAYFAAKVLETVDCGTHTIFVADVTEAKTLSEIPPVTYDYYFQHIKPKPIPAGEKKKGFVCKICGYVYEGETLPPDYICPICKHGAEDFEPLQ